MNKKTVIPFLAATVLGSAILGINLYSSAASNHTQSKSIEVSGHETNDDNLAELQAKAKLTSDEAKAIALKKVAGTVEKSEIEDEDGVVVYGFEIQAKNGEVKDVKVNAQSGKVIKVESDNQENGQEQND